jgi:hypothetical protein
MSAYAEVTYQNRTQTLRQWADELHLNFDTIKMRYRRGQRDPSKLFAPASYNPKAIDLEAFLGEQLFAKLSESAKHYGVSTNEMARHAVYAWLKTQ